MWLEQNLAHGAARLGILLLTMTTSELDLLAVELSEKSSRFLFSFFLIILALKYKMEAGDTTRLRGPSLYEGLGETETFQVLDSKT